MTPDTAGAMAFGVVWTLALIVAFANFKYHWFDKKKKKNTEQVRKDD